VAILALLVSPIVGIISAWPSVPVGRYVISRLGTARSNSIFKKIQIISSACVSLTHGSNDAQKTMGIVAMFVAVTYGYDKIVIEPWMVLACALYIGFGTALGGWRIIRTLGEKIGKEELSPSQGFAAETGTAITIALAHIWAHYKYHSRIISRSRHCNDRWHRRPEQKRRDEHPDGMGAHNTGRRRCSCHLILRINPGGNMTDPLRSIMNLFAKSPFKPLTEHAEKVKLTVANGRSREGVHGRRRPGKIKAMYLEISDLEHQADTVKNNIRMQLPSTLLMPVDRTDILSFLKQEDDVANSAEMVAEMLTIRPIKLPPPVKEQILKLEDAVLTTVNEHVEAVEKIVDLLDSSFSSKRVKEIQEIIAKVDTQKHQVDVIRRKAMKTVYENEKDLGAVNIYILINIIEELSWVAGHAESSSDRMRLITAKR
jgi:predicted phosphate transport protein (TIGR00153 family)